MKLKDVQCRNAKPKEKPYKLADGGGMYLESLRALFPAACGVEYSRERIYS